MPLPPGHPAPTGAHHEVSFLMRGMEFGRGHRTFDVHATKEEIAFLAGQGFLVRERLFDDARTAALRAALDEVAATEGGRKLMTGARNYGGVFLRHLMDKHPAFLDLVGFDPIVSIARAVLGPLVAIRGFSARIAYPGEPNQETEWHLHHRVLSEPLAPWFMPPQILDVLIYLDGADADMGRLCVVPGSHRFLDRDLPPESYDDRPDQFALDLPPGSAVFCHGNLWHRATPTTAKGRIRRLLIWGFGPTWMKESKYGIKPKDAPTDRLADSTDDPLIRELLGRGGAF